jgi:hypothetical protein
MALECYSNAEKGKTAQKSQDSLWDNSWPFILPTSGAHYYYAMS